MKADLSIGDVIVVNKYISPDNVEMKQHSFVVLNNQSGTVAGI